MPNFSSPISFSKIGGPWNIVFSDVILLTNVPQIRKNIKGGAQRITLNNFVQFQRFQWF